MLGIVKFTQVVIKHKKNGLLKLSLYELNNIKTL